MRQSSRIAAASASVSVAAAAAAAAAVVVDAAMSRKDDPVLNVRFVQLVECHPCLWNSNLPAYSKKEEIQKAWQEVANETKDTVRNCRERWRTIRSSFLRSLKLSRTTTGRGKRKYYLSKYLQFLIPYTKTRLKNGGNIIALRKVCLQAPPQPPMTHIKNMPMPIVSSSGSVGASGGGGVGGGDDTKDSIATALGIAEEDVVVSLHEGGAVAHLQQQQQQQQQQLQSLQPPRLPTPIKTELGTDPSGAATASTAATNTTSSSSFLEPPQPQLRSSSSVASAANAAVDLTEFAEWIKSKNDHQRHCLMPLNPPDADQSFLNSLHPFLKEMSGKQNRRFRQKVVALIDAILDNAD